MMRVSFVPTVSALLVVASPIVAAGSVVYSNGDLTGGGIVSNLGASNTQVAESFLSDEPLIITDIRWYGFVVSGAPESEFTIQFYGLPFGDRPSNSTLVAEFVVDSYTVATSGVDSGPSAILEYGATIPALTLPRNTFLDTAFYHLSIFESSGSDSRWVWADTDGGANDISSAIFAQPVGTGFWEFSAGGGRSMAFAFANDSSIPAPGTLPLLSAGLMALALSRRRALGNGRHRGARHRPPPG